MGVGSDNIRCSWNCRTRHFRKRIISIFSGYLRDRVRSHRMELSEMSGFIDYELENELKRLCREGFLMSFFKCKLIIFFMFSMG